MEPYTCISSVFRNASLAMHAVVSMFHVLHSPCMQVTQCCRDYSPAKVFEHPELPLLLDIGCAKGRWAERMSCCPEFEAAHGGRHNFLGVELFSPLVDLANARRDAAGSRAGRGVSRSNPRPGETGRDDWQIRC